MHTQHLELRRDHVDPLGDVLDDPMQGAGAAWAALVCDVDDLLDPQQMRRQRSAVAISAGCPDLAALEILGLGASLVLGGRSITISPHARNHARRASRVGGVFWECSVQNGFFVEYSADLKATLQNEQRSADPRSVLNEDPQIDDKLRRIKGMANETVRAIHDQPAGLYHDAE
jgi:hypothetical protein